ncbi:MAG: 50S ribosomal protein L6 [Alphaproteobacteria bacterium]
MSRVGKNPVAVPSDVTVSIVGNVLKTKGKNGELSLAFDNDLVDVKVEDKQIVVKPRQENKKARAMWGTIRARANNMVKGVSVGFIKKLEIVGVGYKARVQGSDLVLSLGYSHEVEYKVPQGIKVACATPTSIEISGADKQVVGQVAAEVRAYRLPEPYKGKGVKYEGEAIRRKEGKKK